MSRPQPLPPRSDAPWLVEFPGNSTLLTMSVYPALSEISDEWKAFETRAAGTFYQTHAWCAAWLAGDEERSEPRIVVGRDRGGVIRFLLPFAIRRKGAFRVLEWIAMPQTTYGYGLYDRDFLPTARAWFSGRGWALAHSAGPADVLYLGEMPERLHGFPHPLSDWFSCEGPNRAYQIHLERDFEALYQRKRSSATRRSNRKRDTKLESLGELGFGLPDGSAQIHARLDEMFAQQQVRLAERGIHGVFDERDRTFIHRVADSCGNGEPTLLAYHLHLDRRMVAMKLGGLYGNTYWGLISSLDSRIAPHLSPGDAALRRLIAACCERRLATLDLASGDASYKSQWADTVIPLHACIRGLTLPGYLWACGAFARIVAKRTVKRSPRLWAFVQGSRRVLGQIWVRSVEPPLSCLIGLNIAGII
jgi:CelD/BcsL family acetyltransferase involved in cellulose biosynthesis